MHKLLSKLLIVAAVFLSVTFAGMAFFGMESQSLTVGQGMCMNASCEPMGHATDTANCLNSCIDQASPLASVPVSFAAVALVLFALWRIATPSLAFTPFASVFSRWGEGIGKFLRHAQLSTIVLRN